MPPHLNVHSVTLPPDHLCPLHITATRYSSRSSDAAPPALTLVLLHSTSFHKETWEPTLDDLFQRVAARVGLPVCEAWSIECPNHGASADLNEQALQRPEYLNNFTCEKYAAAVHRFLLAGSATGAKVDFESRNLVGIGHSLGGVAIAILQQLTPRVPFRTLILVEPMLSPKGAEHLKPLRAELVRSAYERRDVWPSRQHALDELKRRGRTRTWDPRTLDVFVKHALRTHHGARFADAPYDGVTLCCTRDQEAGMYRDVDGPTRPVLDLNEACARLPIHVIFGAVNDYIPREVQDALVDPASPRRFASVTRIENAGHLVPHQAPAALASAIANILHPSSGNNNNNTTARL